MGVLETKPELQEAIVDACSNRRAFEVLCSEFSNGNDPWPQKDIYGSSKLLMHIASRNLAFEHERHDSSRVVVSTVCPGFVSTRMGGPMAPLSPEQGAAFVVELARLDSTTVETGGFW